MSSRSIQGRLAAEVRHRPNDDHTELQREFKAARLAEFIEKHLAAAPPLTDQQRADLARMFAAGGAG